MAIKSNKKIDFEYEFSDASIGGVYSFSLRFYHTEDYGPTIAFLDESGDPIVNFPIGMFTEVSDFLVDQGIVEGKKTLPMPQSPPKMVKPAVASSRPSLPKPKIIQSKPKVVSGGKIIQEEDQIDITEEVSEEMSEAEEKRMNSIKEAIEGAVPAQSLSTSAEQQFVLSEEEAKEMLEQRKLAIANKGKTAKTIHRKD